MISTDFAPNESWDDAWESLKLIFQPWRWKRGTELIEVNEKIKDLFKPTTYKLHPTTFLSGRSALYCLLNSLNLAKGSRILVQAFTCEAVILPIIELGLKPVYIDIESETYSMNYDELSNKLTNKSKVLILQHTFALTPVNRIKILKLAAERNLVVIEDLAHGFNHSIFSTIHSLQPTAYLLLSFGRSKAFSSVFGGALVSANNQVTDELTSLRYPSFWFIFLCLIYKPVTMLIKSTYDFYLGKILHKILNKLKLIIPEITKKEKKGNYDQLFNKAYPNALAILLRHQLNKFDQVKQQRAKICDLYFRQISKFKFLISNQFLNNQKLNFNLSLIRFPLLVNNRDEIIKKLAKQNIFLGKWYDQVVGPNEINLERVGYISGSCPKAEEIAKKIINLPTNIPFGEAKRVIDALNDVN